MYRGGLSAVVASAVILTSSFSHARDLYVNELVPDPQQDWNGSGSVTTLDEWLELTNLGVNPISLAGMELRLIDTTPESMMLDSYGSIAPNGRLVVINPPGMQNDNGRIELYNTITGTLVDGFSYGNWPGNIWNVPNGNATGISDESISRFPEGSNYFSKTTATYGTPNVSAPGVFAIGGLAALVVGRRKR